MVIEHTFITTMEAADALRAASEFLTARGFSVNRESAFAVGGGGGGQWDTLEVTRGVKSAARAKSVAELPQRVRLEFDRGRVTIAAAIEYFQRGSFTVGSQKEPPAHSPKVRLHVDLLSSLVEGLEQALARRVPPLQAGAAFDAVQRRIETDAAHRRRKRRTTLVILIAIFVILFVVAIWANLQ